MAKPLIQGPGRRQFALSGVVPIRFSIFDATQHYHVPMLCAPWFFSTYRGA